LTENAIHSGIATKRRLTADEVAAWTAPVLQPYLTGKPAGTRETRSRMVAADPGQRGEP
jgi:hypothetical protein